VLLGVTHGCEQHLIYVVPMSESFAIVLHCFLNGLANVTREKWATERKYCGNGLSPPTPPLTIKFNLFIAPNSSSSSPNSSKCLNVSSCVIGDLEIELWQWAFLSQDLLQQTLVA
jgi:hypothetical protein